jgi:hypothetical protein
MSDNFGATSGALTSDAATLGGTWASMGGFTDANDFTETAAPDNAVIRTDVSDASTDIRYGRGVVLGSTNFTDVTTSVDVAMSAVPGAVGGVYGVMLRFVDNSNFVLACVAPGPVSGGGVLLIEVISGVQVVLAYAEVPLTAGVAYTLSATIRATGMWEVSFDGNRLGSGLDSALATGGIFASGKSGLYDWHGSATARTRTYSNFRTSIPASSAAVYASQDLEFRTNEIVREIAAGGVYGVPSISSQPFQPEITPAGAEGLTNRILFGTSRFNPDLAGDPLSDPGSLAVYYEPTWSFARSVS